MATKPSRTKPVIQSSHKQIIVKDDNDPDQGVTEESQEDDANRLQTHNITLTPSPELLKQVNDADDTENNVTETEESVSPDKTKSEEDDVLDKSLPDKEDKTQADLSREDPDNSSEDKAAKEKTAAETVAEQHIREIDQIVESGRYFLPINQLEKRHNRKMVLFGLVICVVLLVAWLDIALDAGIIPDSNNLPHTHFFIVRP